MSDQIMPTAPFGKFVDPVDGTRCFKTSGGVVLDLGKGVPPLIYQAFLSQQLKNKPKPPIVEKRMAGRLVLVEQPDEENYRSELSFWAISMNQNTNEFLASYVRTQPPTDFLVRDLGDSLGYEFDEISPMRRKVLWILTLFETEQEVEAFAGAMTELTMPTEEAITKVEKETFPAES